MVGDTSQTDRHKEYEHLHWFRKCIKFPDIECGLHLSDWPEIIFSKIFATKLQNDYENKNDYHEFIAPEIGT